MVISPNVKYNHLYTTTVTNRNKKIRIPDSVQESIRVLKLTCWFFQVPFFLTIIHFLINQPLSTLIGSTSNLKSSIILKYNSIS